MFSVLNCFYFFTVETPILDDEFECSVNLDILPADLYKCFVFDFKATLECEVDFDPTPKVLDLPQCVDLGLVLAVVGYGLEMISASSWIYLGFVHDHRREGRTVVKIGLT